MNDPYGSDVDLAEAPMRCPFCESADVEVVSPWGGQLITSQARCRSCNTYFEAVRETFENERILSGADDRGPAPA